MSTPAHTPTMLRGADSSARPAPADSSARPAPAVPTAPGRSGGGSRSGFTSLLAAEAIKLRRSSAWVIAVLLPLLAVITGTVNFIMNRSSLHQGWVSLTSQITLFYSMMFCSLGVALLASTVWRVEHRGTSWNAMRTTPHSPTAVALAKTLVILVPVLAMQVVLLALTWLAGAIIAGLGPAIPIAFVASSLLATLGALPLVALQSLLSMLMRSFAAPVALAFVGCVIAFGLMLRQSIVSYAVPQGILNRTLMLGSSALDYAGDLTLSSFLPIMVAITVTGAVLWGLLALVSRRTGGAR